jgi:P4 family phage/plasmid primase-like protien
MDKKHKKQLICDLNLHLSLGRRVFPLSPGSKIPPRGIQWTRRTFSESQLLKFIERGHNLGWALGLQDCVLDIDPRHPYANESFLRLGELLGIAPGELSDLTASVNSGGADLGQHYYMRLPPNVKVKTNHPDYPDLLFKRHGGYVVLPGSLHPDSGRYYDWDYFSPYKTRPMLMPPKLLELLEIKEERNVRTNNTGVESDVSIEEVQHYLMQLDPKDFRTRQSWIELAFAVHSTIGEAGRELFLVWSEADDQYNDCEDENEKIWESIRDDNSQNLRFGTLVKMVLDKGGILYRLPAAQVFNDGYDPGRRKVDSYVERISKLPPNQSDREIRKLVAKAHSFGASTWDKLLRRETAECLGLKYSTIDKFYRQAEKDAKRAKGQQKPKKIDYPEAIASKILRDNFDEGETLIHAINQRFYQYIGTHWIPLQDNETTKLLYDTSFELIALNKAKHEASSKVYPAMTALIAKTTKPSNDVFNFTGEIKSVINCANGELWLNPKTGEYDFRQHDPKSYLLYCLGTEYDPDAKCPIWDETLEGVFRDHADADEMIRHLHEIFGYLIQPNKDIAAWFLWHGGGRNGKSTCVEILQATMGDHAVLPRPIHDFGSQGQSAHALTSLVGKLVTIDDDADIDRPLPASALKKLAEGKLWEANPKHKDQFTFRSSATPVVLYNGWPRVRDLTDGMLRRVHIIPFFRKFVAGVNADDSLRRRIIKSELPGVLNRALEGLRRLRDRRAFAEPVDCQMAKREWLRRSNKIMDWLMSTCNMGNGAWTSMHNLYQSYLDWAVEMKTRFPQSQTDIESRLLQRGLSLETREGVRGFSGIEVKNDIKNKKSP